MSWQKFLNADAGWTIFFLLGAITQMIIDWSQSFWISTIVVIISGLIASLLWQLFMEAKK